MLLVGALVIVLLAAIQPAAARADGPVTPTATDYLARVTHVPPGLQAKIVDGYLNVWMQAPASETVVVRDYYGAPFVRFDRAGVQINLNSREYYLNQVPEAEQPPADLTPSTPPHWVSVSSGHAYMWREGRLHAFAAEALTPGQSFVGDWRIPVTVDGHLSALSGSISHTGAPSIIWFWPVLVTLLCALAAWRVRSDELDRRLSRIMMLTLYGLIAVGMFGRYLHGRPDVKAGSILVLILILAALGLAAWRVWARRSGLLLLATTAIVSLWVGLTLVTVLTHGYVLLAIPAFLARADAAALLGGSLSLALVGLRTFDRVPA